MSWVPVTDCVDTDADPLAPHADGIVAHMNDDHAEACLTYTQFCAGHSETTSVRMIGVDQLGMDLMAITPAGFQPARVNFDEAQRTPEGVRKAVVALLVRARTDNGS
jgi:putative heme iron utilization protein